ncbi:MAG: hypothetical protein ACRYFX_00490 [Janthinobacterium lividum]
MECLPNISRHDEAPLLPPGLGATHSPCPNAAQTWPRNAKTGKGKVEFWGRLPWPAKAVTDEQQQELVWRWYWARLVKPFEYNPAGPSEPTYASLPDRAYFRAKDRRDTALVDLVYTVRFTVSQHGLTYHLFDFSYNYMGYKSNWQYIELPLEQVLVPHAR